MRLPLAENEDTHPIIHKMDLMSFVLKHVVLVK